MRVRTNLFASGDELEVWLEALSAQLGPQDDLSPAYVIGPITALEELAAIARGVGMGGGDLSRPDAVSLQADALGALKELGDETRRASGTALTEFLAAAGKIGRRVQAASSAKAVIVEAEGSSARCGAGRARLERRDPCPRGWGCLCPSSPDDAGIASSSARRQSLVWRSGQ